MTKGDNIEILYNEKIYGILVMEIKPPGNGISIVETDLEVDFAPPVGYQEPTPVPRSRPIMVMDTPATMKRTMQKHGCIHEY